MKRYVIVAVALAVLLFVVLIFRLRRGSNDRTPLVSEPPPQALAPTNSTPPPEATGPAGQPASADAGSSAVTRAQDDESDNAARYYREFPDVPVTLYGLVLDQDSNPLQAVKIDVEVTQWDPNASPGTALKATHVEGQTGADGHFQVSGLSGHSVAVEGLTKRGYEPELIRRHYGEHGPQAGSINEPVVFTLWNTNLHQQLITGERRFTIIPDRRPYVIDLTNGTIAESGTGDLNLQVECTTNAVRGQVYDWSAEIRANNGGLLEETNGYAAMSLAPDQGYVDHFRQAGPMRGGGSGSTGNRRFYVALNHGRQYGRISIELVAPFNSEIPGLIRLSYTVNPSGSRVLW